MSKIAIQSEAYNIGGKKPTDYSANKCVRYDEVRLFNCDCSGPYANNQLVQLSDLSSKGCIITFKLNLNLAHNDAYVVLVTDDLENFGSSRHDQANMLFHGNEVITYEVNMSEQFSLSIYDYNNGTSSNIDIDAIKNNTQKLHDHGTVGDATNYGSESVTINIPN